MGIVSEGRHHGVDIGMDKVVFFDSFGEIGQLLGGGQFTEEDQEGDFQEGALFCQDFDRVSSVFKNTFITINVGDLRGTSDGVHISRVICSEDETFVLDFLEVGGFDEAVGDGNFVAFSRASIIDGEGLLALDLFGNE